MEGRNIFAPVVQVGGQLARWNCMSPETMSLGRSNSRCCFRRGGAGAGVNCCDACPPHTASPSSTFRPRQDDLPALLDLLVI